LRERLYPIQLRQELWLPPLILAVLLLVWEVGVRTGLVPALFFPAPSTIGRTVLRMLGSGALLADLRATLGRLSLGLLLGGGAGLLLGLIMGWSRRLRVIIDPFVAAVHPIPKIAILPLIMILVGIGEASKVLVVAVATFFPMLISTMDGVRQISPIHFEVAESYGASTGNVFTQVVVPGSLPLILTGTRLALNTGLVVIIAAELVTARQGLGSAIWMAWETLRTEELYAVLLVTAVLGFGFNRFLQYLTQRAVPWQVERSR
jgi:NitT/TauT family transport system permease protein